MDQDVLNYVFKDNIVLLPLRFTLQISALSKLKNNMAAVQTNPEASELLEASQNPAIIHYTTEKKPWSSPDCEMGNRFWKEAKRSPFYRQILRENNLVKPKRTKMYWVKNLLNSFYKKITRRS